MIHSTRSQRFVAMLGLALVSLFGVGCADEVKPPVADATGPSGEVAVGATVQLDGSKSTDPGDLPLEFRWRFTEVPAGSTTPLVAEETAKPHFVADVTGTYVVELVVSNGPRASAPVSVSVTAGACGTHSPVVEKVAAAPGAPSVGEPVRLSATVTDADTDEVCGLSRVLAYAWSFSKVPEGSLAEIRPVNAVEPSFTPDVVGSYELSLVVSDELGRASVAGTLVVEVGECGTAAPEIEEVTASPAKVAIGQTTRLEASVSDADTATPCDRTETFSYAWSLAEAPTGSEATLNLAESRTPSVTADVPGDYVIELVVTDAQGHRSGVGTKTVTASTCGDSAPVIASVAPSPSSPAVGEVVQLAANVTDADEESPCKRDEIFEYAWSLVSLPAGSEAALNARSATDPSFTPDVPGDYVVRLVVTDSTGRSSEAVAETVTASTCGSHAPVAQISELVPDAAGPSAALVAVDSCPGRTVQVTATSSTDADTEGACGLSDPLTYQWRFVELPIGSNANVNNREIVNPWFDIDDSGTYVLELAVTDSTGLASTATFTITGDPASCVNVPDTFSITTLAVDGLFDQPQGIAKDGAGNIYVAQNNADSILKVDSSGNVATFAGGGFLNGPRDLAFDTGTSTLFASAGGGRIVKLDTLGVQTSCLSGGGADYNGIQLYAGTSGFRLVAADENQNRIAFVDPGACSVTTTNDFGGVLDGAPWGVAAAVVTAADNVFATDPGNQEIWRNIGGAYVTDSGTEVRISNDGRLDELRDIVVTPCGTPKLLVADRNQGEIYLFSNAGGAPLGIFAAGFDAPVGLLFEDATNLLVTDENTDALFRVTGDFCAL